MFKISIQTTYKALNIHFKKQSSTFFRLCASQYMKENFRASSFYSSASVLRPNNEKIYLKNNEII